jgi:hypothetical protein
MYVIADQNVIIDGQGHEKGYLFNATDTDELQKAIKDGRCHVASEKELKDRDGTDKARGR